MNAEFFAAIEDIEREKGIPKAYMIDKINQALLAAFKKDNPAAADNVMVVVDEDKKKIFAGNFLRLLENSQLGKINL